MELFHKFSDYALRYVNRVEVIGHTGRAYVLCKRGIRVQVQLQDGDRTLKVFIEGGGATHEKG